MKITMGATKVATGIVFGLVLAVAFALPAVGAPGPLQLAKQALSVGKKADRKASQARKTAQKALRSGRQATNKSNRALARINSKVPRAGQADAAAVADKLAGVTIKPIRVRVPVSASSASEDTARAQAEKVELFSQGSLTIYAKCFAETGNPANPGTIGEIYFDTSAEGVIYDSNGPSSGSSFINPGAPEEDRVITDQSSYGGPDPGTLNIYGVSDSPLHMIAPDVTLQAELVVATKVGSPPGGDGVFGPGDGCIFAGHVIAH